MQLGNERAFSQSETDESSCGTKGLGASRIGLMKLTVSPAPRDFALPRYASIGGSDRDRIRGHTQVEINWDSKAICIAGCDRSSVRFLTRTWSLMLLWLVECTRCYFELTINTWYRGTVRPSCDGNGRPLTRTSVFRWENLFLLLIFFHHFLLCVLSRDSRRKWYGAVSYLASSLFIKTNT